MKKIAKFYLVLCWAFFIVKLTSFPAQGEYAPAFSYLDKFVHVFLFFVLTSLLINILKDLFNKYWLIGIISFFISSSYSYLIEYCQLFIEGRFSSFFDLTAGIFGGLLAVFIAYELYYRQPKLLLHICCVGCGVYISQILKKRFKITLYFYNPNIYPASEYDKRLAETKIISKKLNLNLIIGKYEHNLWLKRIQGHEKDRERGGRCLICYRERLEKTIGTAKKKGYDYFSTTLTTSPHKDAQAISKIGRQLEKKYKVKFLDQDFKKQDGFKKSVWLSKRLGLYRQNYCGCEFSGILENKEQGTENKKQ